jgi:hydrogenase maturation protease
MIKLVAIGNRFMQDDGIAIHIAEDLEETLKELNLEIIIGETDCQGAFYSLDKDDFVIIMDAQYIGSEPGHIHLFSLEEAISKPSIYCMQHDMNIIELMKLYNQPFRGYLIGIEVASIALGYELSPILQEKFPLICSKIKALIKNIILEESNNA